jgi:sugar phosphate isomerase/epimerase
MKFGLCTGLENLELTEKLGFDYVECTVTSIAALSGEDFAALEARVKKSSIKMERFNVLFPGTIKLIGPEADQGKMVAYLEGVFPRLKALGGSAVVFGSGRSRAFPQDIPFREGFKELIQVTRKIGETAGKHGLTIVIEPLNRGETNCINSVKEGAMLEAAVDMPSVKLLADLYHILKEQEPLENILAVKELRHTHIAFLEGRAYPTSLNQDVENFFSALKQIGYSGTLSIEGSTKDIEKDAAAGLKVLRSAAG